MMLETVVKLAAYLGGTLLGVVIAYFGVLWWERRQDRKDRSRAARKLEKVLIHKAPPVVPLAARPTMAEAYRRIYARPDIEGPLQEREAMFCGAPIVVDEEASTPGESGDDT